MIESLIIINFILLLINLVNCNSERNYPCNIPKISLHSINNLIEPLPDYPIIFVDSKFKNLPVQKISQRDNLLKYYGSDLVKLSSSNTFSHGLKVMELKEYINTIVDKNIYDNKDIESNCKDLKTCVNYNQENHQKLAANESYYMFGNNYDGIWGRIGDLYEIPPCINCDIGGAKTIGIGGENSGVSFHYHGPGFSETIIGSKRWFLFPPSTSMNTFDPNMTVYEWVNDIYPSIIADSTNDLKECVIKPNEILFFPTNWIHATLNLEKYNFFVSLFLDLQLMNVEPQLEEELVKYDF